MPPVLSRELFIITTPGLEAIAIDELRTLGVGATAKEPGGIGFTGDLRALYRANLHLRTASRIIQRVATFHARSFPELERRIRRIPWSSLLATGEIDVRATCHRSRLYHSDAVASRVKLWATEERSASAATAELPPQMILVRLADDVCTVSLDSSGELLHVRGYRQALAKAPLRETLAAAMVIASGWDARAPLVDPMCGSGTIPIEAALIARRIPPGLDRPFAFMQWPDFDATLWERVVAEARDAILPSAVADIRGSDRDAGAITAAVANAERAGVAADVTFTRTALTAVDAPRGPGWLVSNPPYGVRVGEAGRLRDLYAALGRFAREEVPEWTIALLSANRVLERQIGLPLEEVFRTTNGGIPVRLVRVTTAEVGPRS
jgi:putative N6-adenine-specific DNA methylase